MNRSLIKIICLVILTAVLALVFGYTLSIFSVRNEYSYLFFALISAVLFLALFVLQTLIIKKYYISALIILAEILIITLCSYNIFSLYLIGAGFIAFLFLYWAYISGRSEYDNAFKIKFFKIGRIILSRAVMGLAILGIFIYISFFGQQNFSISKILTALFIKPLEPMAAKFLPGFSLQMSVQDFFEAAARATLGRQLSQLPSMAREAAIRQAADQLEGNINKSLIIELNPRDKFGDAIQQAIDSLLLKLPPYAKTLTLASLGLALLFLVKAIAFFVNWFIIFISFVIYELFLAFGFIHLQQESRSKEVITL